MVMDLSFSHWIWGALLCLTSSQQLGLELHLLLVAGITRDAQSGGEIRVMSVTESGVAERVVN
jgi:hypothetical protein